MICCKVELVKSLRHCTALGLTVILLAIVMLPFDEPISCMALLARAIFLKVLFA
jgi:hypothetical protein